MGMRVQRVYGLKVRVYGVRGWSSLPLAPRSAKPDIRMILKILMLNVRVTSLIRSRLAHKRPLIRNKSEVSDD